jgi:hypothetical protein
MNLNVHFVCTFVFIRMIFISAQPAVQICEDVRFFRLIKTALLYVGVELNSRRT